MDVDDDDARTIGRRVQHFRYAYCYDTYPADDPDSPLVLHCALRGAMPPLDQPLRITWRAGIDLNPLNLADSNDRVWLRSFIWPDHTGLMTDYNLAGVPPTFREVLFRFPVRQGCYGRRSITSMRWPV